MTHRARALTVACVAASVVGLSAAVCPWPVVLVLALVLAAGGAWWATRPGVESSILRALQRSPSGLVWLVMRHEAGGRWSLVETIGAPLEAWRPGETRYRPRPTDEGPCSYWLDTWPDESGERDARLLQALREGETGWATVSTGTVDPDAAPQVWVSHAVRVGRDRVLVESRDAHTVVPALRRWLGDRSAERLREVLDAG